MSSNALVQAMQDRIAAALVEKKRMETLAAPAVALKMSENERDMYVSAAINAVRDGDYNAFSDNKITACLALLPGAICRDKINEIRTLKNKSRNNRDNIPLQAIKSAVQEHKQVFKRIRKNAERQGALELELCDPRSVAQALIDRLSLNGSRLISFWSGRYWIWVKPCYQELTEIEVTGFTYDFVEESIDSDGNPQVAVKHDVQNILHAMQPKIFLKCDNSTFWIDDEQKSVDDLVMCNNGILTIQGGQAFLTDHTPLLFATSALPFNYDVDAIAPEFERYINTVFNGDKELITALQVFGGYLMTYDTSLQKMAVFIGGRRSGKGTLVRILTALLGKNHVATPKLSSLSGNFGLETLLGKSLAIFPDCHTAGKNPISTVEYLLSISGEDPQDVNAKHKPVISGLTLPVRICLVMNELVHFPDPSGALLERLFFIPFEQSFVGKEDPDLSARIIENEMPGVMNWFLKGLFLLRSELAKAKAEGTSGGAVIRRLLNTTAGARYRDEFQRVAAPVTAFVDDMCVIGPEHEIEESELFGLWECWREENLPGYDSSRGKGQLMSEIMGAFASVRQYRPRQGESEYRPRMLKGIDGASSSRVTALLKNTTVNGSSTISSAQSSTVEQPVGRVVGSSGEGA